jgi:MFS family permease
MVTGLQDSMLGIGGVCGAWISYGTYVSFEDTHQWRIPFGIQIIPAAVLSALILLSQSLLNSLSQKAIQNMALKL